MTRRILIAEGDDAIAAALRERLGAEGFAVELVPDGWAAAAAPLADVDLLLLAVALPGLSGLEVCRRVRARSPVPILMLAAGPGEAERLLGLEIGADDCLPAPLSLPELVGRVRALLRRRDLDRAERARVLAVDGLELDLLDRVARLHGRPIGLTPSEFRLLALLATAPGRPFTRREIVAHLWRSPFVGGERTCDAHIKNLRRKLEDDPARPRRVVTVRNVGYLLNPGGPPTSR